jgi:hypothetical protein
MARDSGSSGSGGSYSSNGSGGIYGSGYGSLPSSAYADDVERLLREISEKGEFRYAAAPEWGDQYAGLSEDAYSAYANRDPFSYDHTTDKNYQVYKKSYLGEGEKAAANAMANAMARTGGAMNSVATAAATQASQDYAAKVAEAIPALEAQAFNKYTQQGQDLLNAYNAARSLRNDDFSFWQGAEYNPYVDSRNQAWNEYAANSADLYNQLAAYQQQVEYENALRQYEIELARDEARYNDAKAQSDLDFEQSSDPIAYAKRQWDKAMEAANKALAAKYKSSADYWHAAAENVRGGLGYSGGDDGSLYIPQGETDLYNDAYAAAKKAGYNIAGLKTPEQWRRNPGGYASYAEYISAYIG